MADLGSDSDSGPEWPPGFEPAPDLAPPHGAAFPLPDLPPHTVMNALILLGMPAPDVHMLEAWLLGAPAAEPPLLTLMRWLIVARALPRLMPRPPALLPPETWLAIVACAELVAHSLASRTAPPPHHIARHVASTTVALARQLADERVAAAEARAAAAEARAAAAAAAVAAAEAHAAQAAADAAAARRTVGHFRQRYVWAQNRAYSLQGALDFFAAQQQL